MVAHHLPGQLDLFEATNAPAMTDAERKRMRRRASNAARGYAAPPGTGPEGETCRSCRHLARVRYSRTFLKCELNRAAWTKAPWTDIRAGSPACRKWQAGDPGT